ncbi:MAG TPA: hypothetical protein VHJ82_03605 [Actinomycetota bacterium]|nr:hypothetical protein [Actinomycetota bacterium]
MIHARLIEARRELDALIGDAYLRPRANIVPVHFLDLASAVEKLRWAEKEWRELDRETAALAAEFEQGEEMSAEIDSSTEEVDDPEPGEIVGRAHAESTSAR